MEDSNPSFNDKYELKRNSNGLRSEKLETFDQYDSPRRWNSPVPISLHVADGEISPQTYGKAIVDICSAKIDKEEMTVAPGHPGRCWISGRIIVRSPADGKRGHGYHAKVKLSAHRRIASQKIHFSETRKVRETAVWNRKRGFA